MEKHKIAVLGGSFNPIHNGHIHFCEQAMEMFKFDRLLLMPVNIPPHKSPVKLVSCTDRINMLELTARGLKGVEVSNLEVSGKLGSKSYTINTVIALREEYPTDSFELYWLIGSDMLYSFEQWYRYQDILKQIRIIAAAREKLELENLFKARERFGQLSDRIEIAQFDALVVSSTQIRERIARGEDISSLVPEVVRDYIKINGLYEG